MTGELAVETVKPGRLSDEARSAWRTFRATNESLRSPYFDLRYVLAAGEAAPGAEVAVISRGGRIAGFLPFQRRGRLVQPLGAPLTDYHGIVAPPNARIDLAEVVAQIGARRFTFSGLVASDEAPAGPQSMVADLSEGIDAYLARRAPGFLKDKRRRAKRLAEDHGEVSFRLSQARCPQTWRFIVTLKRDQLRRTGKHDIFESPWIPHLIDELAQRNEGDFGLHTAVLMAGERVVAAEVGLRSGDVYHLWFPVYDPDFARYSPGSLMTLETIRSLAGMGVRTVDFGIGRESYKTDFAEPGLPVLEGEIQAGAHDRSTIMHAEAASGQASFLRDVGLRLNRRWDHITACEPALDRRLGAASRSVAAVIAKQKSAATLSVGVGLGVSAGLAATLLAE
jgi:CelD/BcsL family acetyltransferase involved in cellulose biosynthesis